MAPTALLVATLLRPILFSSQARQSDETETKPNQTVLYLALGAVLGVAYSLGTEKFIRAMQHRHIFVRNSMLWLSAVAWLFAAAAAAWVASLIHNQVGGGLEGFDRVLGVLIPFVVRADLVVDWAKRVAWALLNMATWTQASVQVRRLLARAPRMAALVDVDDEVSALAAVQNSRQADLLSSEDRVWTEDADSLVRVADVLQHFEKLGRVAFYALGGLICAVPGAIVWILYAAFHGAWSFHKSMPVLGCLYWLSIILAPFGALIMLVASAGLLCGVVTLSVVGTIIQFSVYWSMRTVYSMVRIFMSQAWAGFPDITKPHATRNVDQGPPVSNSGKFAIKAIRHPEEAGAAIAQVGSLLPSELEFALASWDGFNPGDKVKPAWVSRKIFAFTSPSGKKKSSNDTTGPRVQSGKVAGKPAEKRGRPKRASSAEDGEDNEHADGENGSSEPDASPDNAALEDREEVRSGRKENETAIILLGRLGLDLSVKSVRKRRLSTYYAFGMLTHLQVESGGNAWRLRRVEDLPESEFDERIKQLNSIVADEAKIALYELGTRLRGTSKYRVIPTGPPSSRMVSVHSWLRSALLAFLESPAESDGGKRPRDTCKL